MTLEANAPGRIPTLVVDDHPFFREGIAAWVDRQEDLYCCGTADNMPDALEILSRTNAVLVLLDLQLHGEDGFSFLRQTKKMTPKPRVIVLSYKDQTIFAERVLKEGALGYVLKDEASSTMRAAIRTVLRGGVHVSPDLYRRIYGRQESREASGREMIHGLFRRELQVLECLGRGQTTKEIADSLGISPKTVDSYRESLKKKLGVPDSLALIRLATIWQEEGRWDLAFGPIPPSVH